MPVSPRDANALSRRALLQAALPGAVGLAFPGGNGLAAATDDGAEAKRAGPEDRNDNRALPRRRLGRTNMMVTTIGSGGAGITGAEILYRAIEKGINYLDTAPAYGDSEEIFGEVMRTARNQVFLATKWAVLGDWTVDRCLESLHRSLKRLQTDHIDLLQLHSVDTGPGLTGTPRDGYVRIDNPHLHTAMERARKAGKVRFFGVSSHDPHRARLLAHAIDTGLFDTILVAFNYDTFESSGVSDLLVHAHRKDIGVIGMKTGANDRAPHRPQSDPTAARLAWMLSREIHTVIDSGTVFNEDSQNACLAASGKNLTQPQRNSR